MCVYRSGKDVGGDQRAHSGTCAEADEKSFLGSERILDLSGLSECLLAGIRDGQPVCQIQASVEIRKWNCAPAAGFGCAVLGVAPKKEGTEEKTDMDQREKTVSERMYIFSVCDGFRRLVDVVCFSQRRRKSVCRLYCFWRFFTPHGHDPFFFLGE